MEVSPKPMRWKKRVLLLIYKYILQIIEGNFIWGFQSTVDSLRYIFHIFFWIYINVTYYKCSSEACFFLLCFFEIAVAIWGLLWFHAHFGVFVIFLWILPLDIWEGSAGPAGWVEWAFSQCPFLRIRECGVSFPSAHCSVSLLCVLQLSACVFRLLGWTCSWLFCPWRGDARDGFLLSADRNTAFLFIAALPAWVLVLTAFHGVLRVLCK